jgi:MoaA/NifB/PqqE/SkfB family radical SAM enzyme
MRKNLILSKYIKTWRIKMSNNEFQMGLRRENTGQLQSLWIALPRICNLDCPYCYACDNTSGKHLEWPEYQIILNQAKEMGVTSLGIPGAGEPFISGCIDLTKKIIGEATKLGMYATVFSTIEFITEDLTDWLWTQNVELMVKFNSPDPDMQDRFVSNSNGRTIKGYGKRRNEVLTMLMEKGWNDEEKCMESQGRKSRIALVTSIMTSKRGPTNYDQIADILRFCRKNNLIVDCDSILTKGRGTDCGLCTADRRLKQKLLELQKIDREEFSNEWEIGQGYIGVSCDRYMHHMSVNQFGDIRPCIGAEKVILGNTRTTTLEQAWNSTEMTLIRNRCYGGVCGTDCKNFTEGKCNSCLGRRAVDLTSESLIEKGFVDTLGCWNNRPIKKGGKRTK